MLHTTVCHIRIIVFSTFFAVLPLLSGCSAPSGPDYELVSVTGTVTLDGSPLPGAQVIFVPQGDGSISFGTTDNAGKYELYHNVGVKGAALGNYLVQINKIGEVGTPNDTKNLLPPQYNERSKLTAAVSSGPNVVDFQLNSKSK